MLKEGLTGSSVTTVNGGNTAAAMGSGDMEVFATPAMVALAENAAVQAVRGSLPEGATTVGALIEMTHIRPSAPGSRITAKAELVEIDGRKLTFRIEAADSRCTIGEGRHVRYVVDREKFLAGL